MNDFFKKMMGSTSLKYYLCIVWVVCLSACGGGSSSSSASTSNNTTPTVPTSPWNNFGKNIQTLSYAGTAPASLAAGNNVMPITVTSFNGIGYENSAYVSVTVCPPNSVSSGSTTKCQTFNNIQLDTGSTGFRLVTDAKDVIGNTLASANFPPTLDSASNLPIVECLAWVNAYSLGSVRSADLKLGGIYAKSVPFQVIGDVSSTPAKGSDCSGISTAANSTTVFGANGVLGIGPSLNDCGTFCTQNASNGQYYVITNTGSWQGVTMAATAQAYNPAALLQADNNGILNTNGVVITLPQIPDAGVPSATGSLIFGVGTQANNTATSALQMVALSTANLMSAVMDGVSLSNSYIDSGTPFNVLPSNGTSQIPLCTSTRNKGLFCPSFTISVPVILTSITGGTINTVAFAGNADNQYSSPNLAFNNYAAAIATSSSLSASSGVLGLSYFFGKALYVGIPTGATTNGVIGFEAVSN